MRYEKKISILLLLLLLGSCSSSDETLSKQNFHAQYLQRLEEQRRFSPAPPTPLTSPSYPWSIATNSSYRKITKEFFRCKGSVTNPPRIIAREGKEPIILRDCAGGENHGLPLSEGKEHVHSLLIELLNYIQEETQKHLVITSGHRCPTHNRYCDDTRGCWSNKHQIGAEVDFYLIENDLALSELLEIVSRFYITHPQLKTKKEFTEFKKYEKEVWGTVNPAYCNKELFIKYYSPHEGRSVDNAHNRPYFSFQVRFDRERNTPVNFDSTLAENFQRY